MVFKKDLTPIGRGGVTKHRGKGSTMQRVRPGMTESMTAGRPLPPMGGRSFPKPAPAPPPGPPLGPPPAPAMGPPGMPPPGVLPELLLRLMN